MVHNDPVQDFIQITCKYLNPLKSDIHHNTTAEETQLLFADKDLVLILFTFCSMVLCSSICLLLMQKWPCSSVYKGNAANIIQQCLDLVHVQTGCFFFFVCLSAILFYIIIPSTQVLLYTQNYKILYQALSSWAWQINRWSHAGQSEAWKLLLVPAGWVLLAVETAGWMFIALRRGRWPVYVSA